MCGKVLGNAALDAARGRFAIPLHARLIPSALARQYTGSAMAAGHRHHRGVGEPVVGPDGHQVVPAADLSARLASTTFIHSSRGLVVSSSYSKRSTISDATSATST